MRSAARLVFPALALILGACAHETQEARPVRTTAQLAPMPRATDAEIAAALAAANRGEIQQAELALKISTSPEVRSFARAMIQGHADALRQQRQLLAQRGIAPHESELSQSIALNGKNSYRHLSTLMGSEFDRAYVDVQLAQHRQLLSLIGGTFLPDSRDAHLRAFLMRLRSNVESHLAHAEDVETEIVG